MSGTLVQYLKYMYLIYFKRSLNILPKYSGIFNVTVKSVHTYKYTSVMQQLILCVCLETQLPFWGYISVKLGPQILGVPCTQELLGVTIITSWHFLLCVFLYLFETTPCGFQQASICVCVDVYNYCMVPPNSLLWWFIRNWVF